MLDRRVVATVLVFLIPLAAHATPLDVLTVGDPLEAELRALDIAGPGATGGRIRLPRLHTRPLQLLELEPLGPVEVRDQPPGPGGAVSIERLGRFLARDLEDFAGEPGTSPRLYQRGWDSGERLELSLGLEGRGDVDEDSSSFVTGSGVHARIAAGIDRWLVYAHLFAGHVADAQSFADPIVDSEDIVVHTEETFVSYTGGEARWGVQFGRSRWHWGPGEEGSLLLSKTAAPITALAGRVRIEPLRADAIALSATLDAAAGEQLAAHRLEWQPMDGLRLGLAEAARYQSEAWEPLYLVGVIPYVLVQRLQTQDEPDSAGALRNNVLVGIDAAWRIAPGTRIYGELLIDDLHAETDDNPNKLAWQLGLEGVGTIAGTRLVWGAEYTRLSRYVYTSFFGRDFAAQDRPLGFPTGPDSRQIRVRGAWDLSPAWQVLALVSQTDQGENELDEPYVPGSGSVDPGDFEGVVEQTRELELGLRFWPASGIDVALSGGWRWVDAAGHVAGANTSGARGALVLRLIR